MVTRLFASGNQQPPQKPQRHPIKGQSPAAQAQRLDRGCCPVHGIGMSQIDSWFVDEQGRHVTVGADGRKDCDIRVTMSNRDEIVEVFTTDTYPGLIPDYIWKDMELERLQKENAELRARLAEVEK